MKMKFFRKYLLSLSLLLNGLLLNLFSQAPANFNFELSSPGQYTTANAVQGWTVHTGYNSLSYGGISCNPNPLSNIWTPGSSEFSIVSTPILGNSALTPPSIDNQNIPHSPLGGTKVARLNDRQSFNPNITRLSTQFTVSPSLTLLLFAFAASFDASHVCCEGASMRVDIYSCSSATPIPGLSTQLTPNCAFVNGYTTLSNMIVWSNWQVVSKDLSPYAGQCLKLVVTVSDCVLGGHHGTAYFDAGLTGQLIGNGLSVGLGPVNQGSSVSYCLGSNQAIIQAPLGYSNYLWVAPGGFTLAHALPTLTVSVPVLGNTYTCIATVNGVSSVFPFTIAASQVNIVGLGSTNSCMGGSSGSATVAANGSGTGYTYAWLNSNSITVSTSAVASGLSPGVYSVMVSSNTGSACGIASSTVAVGSQSSNAVQTIFKPFCGNEAYMCAGAGSNFQWYNNITPIPAPAGTAQCFTLSNPSNGGIIHLKYASAQGCQDSIKFILGSSAPGNIGIFSSTNACQGSANGSVVISMTPALGSMGGQNSFSVFSTGTLNPVYSASLAAGFQNSFGLVNLPASNYSIIAFDGSCRYTSSLSINPYTLNFTLSPSQATICQGGAIAAGASFTSHPQNGQYSYSWTPNTWLSGGNASLQQTIIFPTTSQGSVSTIIYSVTVTPSLINCPTTKTMAITVANLLSPTITPIPLLCQNSPPYTITVNPAAGNFSVFPVNPSGPVINSMGVIQPSMAANGVNSFSYAISVGSCVAMSSSSFQVGGPVINTTASQSICSGQSLSLTASGANSYTWSGLGTGSVVAVSPSLSTTYTLSASHTLDPCVSSKTIQVFVNPLPTIQIGGPSTLCVNQSGTLTASGAINYTWSGGSTGPMQTITGLAPNHYSVIGSDINNCVNSNTFLVNVNYGPLLQVQGNTLVCKGEPVTLIALGANSYTWAWNQGSYNPTITMIPSTTLVYTLSGLSFTNPCTSQIQHTVFVEACVGDVEAEEFPFKINLYPNPSSGIVFIESQEKGLMLIQNNLSQAIFSAELQQGRQSFDLGHLARGVYQIEISRGIEKISAKLILY